MGFGVSWKEYLRFRQTEGRAPSLLEMERFLDKANELTKRITGAIEQLEAMTAGAAAGAEAFEQLHRSL